MGTIKLTTHGPGQTQRLGNYLGKLARGGDIYLLSGNLGSGKTCLVQGIAFGLGVKEYACSPSFMISREYHGRLTFYHLDFYRLDHIEEIVDLGIDDYFNGDVVSAIEWAEKGSGVLPQNNLSISLEYVSENERRLTFEPKGKRYSQLTRKLKDVLNKDSEVKWSFR